MNRTSNAELEGLSDLLREAARAVPELDSDDRAALLDVARHLHWEAGKFDEGERVNGGDPACPHIVKTRAETDSYKRTPVRAGGSR